MKLNLPTTGFSNVLRAHGFSLEQTAKGFFLSKESELVLTANTIEEITGYLRGWYAGRKDGIWLETQSPAALERKANAAALLGSSTSAAKADAARVNGAKGGRPKKQP